MRVRVRVRVRVLKEYEAQMRFTFVESGGEVCRFVTLQIMLWWSVHQGGGKLATPGSTFSACGGLDASKCHADTVKNDTL